VGLCILKREKVTVIEQLYLHQSLPSELSAPALPHARLPGLWLLLPLLLRRRLPPRHIL
jgi:hypothetical protein